MMELNLEELRKQELKGTVSCWELNRLGFGDDALHRLLIKHVEEIMAYTGEDMQAVADKINGSILAGAELWNSHTPRNERELKTFHSGTDRKIYSMTGICDYLAVIRGRIIKRIADRDGASVLDFGGSHGHITLAAAEAGFDVTYADIGAKVREFVKWRARQRNLRVKFAPIKNNRCVLDKTYDYIVCLDVASHLPDLPGYLKEFHDCLNDNGEFIFGDDLFDFNVPWHLEENKIYRDADKKRELLKGFRFIEHIWANCNAWGKA